MFRSEVWHRGTANHSDRVRYLLQVHYAQRGIAQRFPPYLHRFTFDPDILAIASGRQRRLMGDHPPGELRLSFTLSVVTDEIAQDPAVAIRGRARDGLYPPGVQPGRGTWACTSCPTTPWPSWGGWRPAKACG